MCVRVCVCVRVHACVRVCANNCPMFSIERNNIFFQDSVVDLSCSRNLSVLIVSVYAIAMFQMGLTWCSRFVLSQKRSSMLFCFVLFSFLC